MHWYTYVRSQFISDDFPEPLFEGLKEKLRMAIDERIQRLNALSQKMPESVGAYQNYAKETASSLILKENLRDAFMEKIRRGAQTSGKNYISVIDGLDDADKEHGSLWLQGIVDHTTAGALKTIPSFA